MMGSKLGAVPFRAGFFLCHLLRPRHCPKRPNALSFAPRRNSDARITPPDGALGDAVKNGRHGARHYRVIGELVKAFENFGNSAALHWHRGVLLSRILADFIAWRRRTGKDNATYNANWPCTFFGDTGPHWIIIDDEQL